MDLPNHYDVIIVGGGPAGLSAALILGLARRRVLVVDAGKPRNAAAPISHGFLSRDGVPPGEIAAAAREQLRAYPTVEFSADTVTDATTAGGVLLVSTAAGARHQARKIILATGMEDALPAVPGLAECWAKSIFPCPYCHAWEYRDQPLAMIGNGAGIARTLAVLRSWSSDVALLTNGPAAIEGSEGVVLQRNQVSVYEQPIVAFEHRGGQLEGVVFKDGTILSRKAILYHPPAMVETDLFIRLGLIVNGAFRIDPKTAKTQHPHVFVAGENVGMFAPQIIATAVYSGAFTARHVNEDLALEDFAAAGR